jgi:hypothetical protein
LYSDWSFFFFQFIEAGSTDILVVKCSCFLSDTFIETCYHCSNLWQITLTDITPNNIVIDCKKVIDYFQKYIRKQVLLLWHLWFFLPHETYDNGTTVYLVLGYYTFSFNMFFMIHTIFVLFEQFMICSEGSLSTHKAHHQLFDLIFHLYPDLHYLITFQVCV